MKGRIQGFIEKAIAGGLKTTVRKGPIEVDSAGGRVFDFTETGVGIQIPLSDILLNPLAWQAVGKVEGWNTGMFVRYYQDRVGGIDENLDAITDKELSSAEFYMHRMIDALIEASTRPDFDMQKTIEGFVETL